MLTFPTDMLPSNSDYIGLRQYTSNTHLFTIYCVPGTVLGGRDTSVNKTGKNP